MVNIENLRRFVAALRDVVDTNPDAQEVDMRSVDSPPECGTPGCHAWIAKLALDLIGVPASNDYGYYDFDVEAARLSRFLGLPESSVELEEWAMTHPIEWGNNDGDSMFCHQRAFGQESRRFPARIIADHWAWVLARIEATPNED